MCEVVNLSTRHMPAGRASKAFYGFTGTSSAARLVDSSEIIHGNPVLSKVTDTEEVECWVSSSNTKPLKLLVILDKADRVS